MKLLITGGSGFIGRNLTEYLSAKYNVSAPRHQELDLLDEDKVEAYFKKYNFDVVIHCAVRPGHRNANDSSGQLYNNTRMFFNLARNKDKFKKMIVLSSGLVYDIRYYKPKMKEEYFDAHVPADEGGFSKYIIARRILDTSNILAYNLRIGLIPATGRPPIFLRGPHPDQHSCRQIPGYTCRYPTPSAKPAEGYLNDRILKLQGKSYNL